MAFQKPLPEEINGFKVIQDLGTKVHSGKKRRFAICICKVCDKEFEAQVETLRRKDRFACSKKCYDEKWANDLIEYADFKIVRQLGMRKNKRIVVAVCPKCKCQFETPLMSLKRMKTCGCSRTRFTNDWPQRLVRIRNNMIQRCNNKNSTSYCRYGARGISVCKEWMEPTTEFFEWAMENGYRDDLTIDRIDNDGNYEPSNCRWVSKVEQELNTRKAKLSKENIIKIYNDKRQTKDIAQEYNVSKQVIRCIRNGRSWSSITNAKRSK